MSSIVSPSLLNTPCRVLRYFSHYPEATIREASVALDLTERTVQEVVLRQAERGTMTRMKKASRVFNHTDQKVAQALDVLAAAEHVAA